MQGAEPSAAHELPCSDLPCDPKGKVMLLSPFLVKQLSQDLTESDWWFDLRHFDSRVYAVTVCCLSGDKNSAIPPSPFTLIYFPPGPKGDYCFATKRQRSKQNGPSAVKPFPSPSPWKKLTFPPVHFCFLSAGHGFYQQKVRPTLQQRLHNPVPNVRLGRGKICKGCCSLTCSGSGSLSGSALLIKAL